jgi:hypothetical protein
MPRVPATIAAPNIHFFMLPINPPFQRSTLSDCSGFCHLEAWFLPPPELAVLDYANTSGSKGRGGGTKIERRNFS